jgi:Protein of unknown function (DUF3892)
MADWYITCVKRGPGGVIQTIGYGVNPLAFSAQYCQDKNMVIQLIANGHNLFMGGPSRPRVHVVKGRFGPYLSTDPNETERDNLDGARECTEC